VNPDIEIIELALFSGIGGFSKGLEEGGIPVHHHYYSEIDKQPISVFRKHFKNSTYVGSVTNVRSIIRTIEGARKPNTRLILTFGSPCQDFSLAGKRGGLEGTKSSLIKYALFLIKWLKPDVYIWENVKGAYSTNDGADYWAIIQAFANIDGYRREQQLLNTKWFLPQNRERIYIVGHRRGRSEPGVFPIRESNTEVIKKAQVLYANDNIAGTIGCYNNSSRQCFDKGTTLIHIRSATAKGYEEASIGDSINYSVPTSKTRRGRVGKGVAQTLDTQCNQAVYLEDGIRRLTEIECERLHGYPDDWTKYGDFDGKIKKVSSRPRYKMLGNAVSVPVVKAIAQKLKLS
jgi:DNA (cytosine-5)-methyltransferase 1